MGRSHDEFVKFPRTPHLFGSKGTDDDKHLGESESLRFVADDSLIAEGMHSQCVPFAESRCTVAMLSGLPGSGKDTWLEKNRPKLPVVSPDGVRSELDVEPTDDQGEVVHVARERCREFLRSGRSFAFNVTNLLRPTRRRWIELFAEAGGCAGADFWVSWACDASPVARNATAGAYPS